MEKDIQNDRQSAVGEQPDAVRIVTIRSAALFCTALVTAAVLTACILGAAVAIYQARDVQTASQICPQCETGVTVSKMMDTNKETQMMMRMEDGQMIMERYTYDHESNILLIHVPGNHSGYSAATVALDYTRSIIYANLHTENLCIAFPWSEGLAKAAREFMTEEHDEAEIIDVVSGDINSMDLELVGEIRAGYFQRSTDMTVSAMCAGRQTNWLEDRSVATARLRRWGWKSFAISALKWVVNYFW